MVINSNSLMVIGDFTWLLTSEFMGLVEMYVN